MRRRQMLTASAITIAGLAGCTGGDSTNESGDDSTDDLGDGGDAGSDTTTPEGTVETFYATLYGEKDIDGANALYHPESEAPELVPEDFEDFGGVDNIQSDVLSTEVIEETDGAARVHADVDYTTPVGDATNTDWFTLRTDGDEWLVNVFLPESARGDMSDEEIDQAMQFPN